MKNRVELYMDAAIIGGLLGLLVEVPSWKLVAFLVGFFAVSIIAKMIDAAIDEHR